MYNSKAKEITELARIFLRPSNPTHRRYEALRAFFVEGLPSADAARRFGYSPSAFRVLCHQFRKDPARPFFLVPRKGPRSSPKKDRVRDRVVALRKQNQSVYDIAKVLETEGGRLTPASIATLLRNEGFARLPRRKDEERPPGTRPSVAAVADVREFVLSPRSFSTRFGGLFLFIPYLVEVSFDSLMEKAGLPGSEMIPSTHAMRSLLALKLFGIARHTHFMSHVFDEGLGLFAGLNVIPKRAFLTEYSSRIVPSSYPELMRLWFDAVGQIGLPRGYSFDLDFHTIPFHGEDALVEKHYLTKRSRKQKGILAFLAQDADEGVFCYAKADLRAKDRKDCILEFIDFWEKRTGSLPGELVFDSQLTTYDNLDRLNQKGIPFITLRRRTDALLREIHLKPLSAWKRIELENVARAYRFPRMLDEQITLHDYQGPLRQLTATELGHEEPTILITNQLRKSPAKLMGRYARRMIIENTIEDAVDFFHMDALSSAVPMKINCDLQLSLIASSLYRLLGTKIGNGYADAKSRHIFRDLVDASATIVVGENEVRVRFQKRAHNPLLLAAGFQKLSLPVPWWNGKRLRFDIG